MTEMSSQIDARSVTHECSAGLLPHYYPSILYHINPPTKWLQAECALRQRQHNNTDRSTANTAFARYMSSPKATVVMVHSLTQHLSTPLTTPQPHRNTCCAMSQLLPNNEAHSIPSYGPVLTMYNVLPSSWRVAPYFTLHSEPQSRCV